MHERHNHWVLASYIVGQWSLSWVFVYAAQLCHYTVQEQQIVRTNPDSRSVI